MRPLVLSEVQEYILSNIREGFYDKKAAKVQGVSLEDIVKRKNPYLYRAKGSESAHDYISDILDATVTSGEETVFGNFLERVAIYVCERVYDGRKSGVKGLDLEFEDGTKKYLVSIKSGPNWGNSSQINKMLSDFKEAKRTLQTSGGVVDYSIVFVEACCYGVDNNPDKGTHLKLCGQRFWELISGGDKTLYRDIIGPLGKEAHKRNEEIQGLISQKLNVLTAEFVGSFCDDGVINWDKLIRFNSGKPSSEVAGQ